MKSKCNSIQPVAIATAVLALLLTTSASAQNLLTNPDFETGDLSGWNLVGPDFSQSIGAPGMGAQSGNFAVNLTAPSDGVPEVSQGIFGSGTTFPASPGQEFNLSGYMLTEVALPPVDSGATFGLLKIVFEDAAGNDLLPASASEGQINSDFPGIESLPFLNGDSEVNTWLFTEAQGVAPADTVSVAFLVLNVDFGNGADHPMWFDNISATEVMAGNPGDFDTDGDVDGDDFVLWQRDPNIGSLTDWEMNYGTAASAGAAATAVPEPTSLVLLLGLGVASAASRRRWDR